MNSDGETHTKKYYEIFIIIIIITPELIIVKTIYSWLCHKAWFQYNIITVCIMKGMCHYNHKFSTIRLCICQHMNIWCNLIFRIDGGLQGGDEVKHLCFYCSFYKPPRTRLLSCYCSCKFTSFHYVRHSDITCLEIYRHLSLVSQLWADWQV